ncbi:MAG: AMP-dependent synthetase, partial [Merismopedia sp. SIO2A8]|nr:AMP-dependent synthetase [Merismopedia sp. SIO2A8]
RMIIISLIRPVTKSSPFCRNPKSPVRKNGELFVTGRIKEMIIIRGQNYYPQDIEMTVENSHPALRAGFGAAFAVEIKGEEQLVVAYEVERSYLRKLNVAEVVGAIRQAVSEQQEIQVNAVVLLKTASIPKTSSGKIQRHACRSGFLAGNLEIIADWTENPANKAAFISLEAELNSLTQQLQMLKQQPSLMVSHSEEKSKSLSHLKPDSMQKIIESWLVIQLSLYLKIAPTDIDIKETFAHYGLDSAVAISLTNELGKWLDCELEATLFWEYSSIDSLAQHLAHECQLSSLKSPTYVAEKV